LSADANVSPASARQTLSYLRQLFEQHGLHPKKKLGQSFLIDLNLRDLVVRAADLDAADVVLEVGTGTGSLTGRLASLAGAVLSVEVDSDFHRLARELFGPRANLRLLHCDVLKNKNTLNPVVTQALAELCAQSPHARLKLVANLPYAVATPVLANLLLLDLALERMVAMIQLELAERLLARPGSKDYGALAVLFQSVAHVEMVRGPVSPTVFWPPPQVFSAIIRIRPDVAKRARVGDVAHFRAFLRDLYTHRRKNLRSALAGLPSGRWSKREVDVNLARLGFEGTLRAEDLDLEAHLRLAKTFG
jgi:16S rRNA (adenine1518-N6/adenine1519-N6)-dimethyltransferase